MKIWHKFLIGGLGGCLAVFGPDIGKIMFSWQEPSLSLANFICFLFKLFIAFGLGSLMVALYKDEENLMKLLQLGLAAPAFFIGISNGANIAAQNTNYIQLNNQFSAQIGTMTNEINELKSRLNRTFLDQGTPNQNLGRNFDFKIFIVNAQYQQPNLTEFKQFSLPKVTTGEKILKGIYGSGIPENTWFVIVGSHINSGDAVKQAEEINQKMPDFHAEVYAPYGGNPYHAVVIGSNLTLNKAKELRKKAVAAGLPKDTYLWTLPLHGD